MANFTDPRSLSRGQSTTAFNSGILYTDQRQFYINPYSYSELWPAATPFISAMIERSKVITNLPDPVFKMFQHENPWRKQELTILAPSAATIPDDDTGITITVDSVTGLPDSYITANGGHDSIENQQFEIWDEAKTTKRGVVFCFLNNAGTYTIKNCSSTAITGVVATDVLVLIGTTYGEGSEAGEAWADELQVVWGNTGIHRTPVEIYGTLMQASLRGANKELQRLRMQKLYQHKINENRRLMRSKSTIGTNLGQSETFSDKTRTGAANGLSGSQGGRVRSPYGLIPMIEDYGSSDSTSDTQNIFDFSGGLIFNQWVDASEKVFQYQNYDGMRDFFCGPKAMSYFSKLDTSGTNTRTKMGIDIRMSDMKNSKPDGQGYNFRFLETPFGIARLILEPSLKFEYSNYMLSPQWENVYYAVYRPFEINTAIKDKRFNGYDGIKDDYFSDTGIGATLIKSHMLLKVPLA